MSFREKSAWITLISVVLCFGVYFIALAAGGFKPYGMRALHYALMSIIALIVLQVVLHVIARMSNPREARAPRDEREYLIEIRSRAVGYYVLMAWMVGIVFAVHVPGLQKVDIVYIAWLGVAVAIALVALAQIIQYRRGT